MVAAPWESVPEHDTKFILVTGANSGIGFSICQRLIDDYLTTRTKNEHLVLIPTARSIKKSQQTTDALRKHTKNLAETSTALRSRLGPNYDPRKATERIHILNLQLDLCNLPSIYKAADQLVNGRLSSPCDDEAFVSLVDVAIPRLDSIIFNAGNGNFTHLDWFKLVRQILTRGIVESVTWPTFKGAGAAAMVTPIPNSEGDKTSQDTPEMGLVFCSNVFGHHVLAHELLPLLRRPIDSPLAPGRIIWESSIEPGWDCLDLDDFQGIKTDAPYESSKRLTDVLALTATLPSTQPYVEAYLGSGRATRRSPATKPPRIYLVHPGVVHTTLFPLNAVLFFLYRIVLYVARWLGSPWHAVSTYNGAIAPAWLALQDQEVLDTNKAELVKWGSSTTWGGEPRVKKTEVEGWGWDGTVEDWKALQAEAKGLLGKRAGRKPGAVDLTPERRVEFEELGAKCWRELERTRAEWEAKLKSVHGTPNGKPRPS